MGLAFLPWERLPAWLLGLIFAVAGAFLLFDAEPYSWRQAQAVGMAIVGVWMFLSRVIRLVADPDIVSGVDFRKPSPGSTPDYAKYSESELRQVLTRIDRERYPERVVEIEARLSALECKRG